MATDSDPPSDSSVKKPALTNPARRLHALLESGRSGGVSAQNIGMMDGLSRMFALANSNESEIYTKLATFLRLLGTVERRCNAASDKKANQFLYAIGSVQKAFKSFNPGAPWNSVMSNISQSDMALLYLAADYFDGLNEEALIDGQTLKEINDVATALIEEISSGNLDERLKVIILDQLDAIRRAVEDYKIRGAEGLKKALAESSGMVILEWGIFAKNEGNTSVKKFWDILTKINTAVRAAELAYYLGGNMAEAIKYLPFLS